jgi:hypothetical protein
MVEFIQKSGIPIAMVGLLQAMPGTELFRRLRREGRIVDAGGGNNTDDRLNFLPHMDAARLVEGYRSVLKRIYNCEAYYERVKLYLNRAHPKAAKRGPEKDAGREGSQRTMSEPKQRWMTVENMRALAHSIVRQGVFGRRRWSYWKFLATAATRYRRCFGAAMTLAVMGHHFQVMTQKLSKAKDKANLPGAVEESVPEPASGE